MDASIIAKIRVLTEWNGRIKALVRRGYKLFGVWDIREETITECVLSHVNTFDDLALRSGVMMIIILEMFDVGNGEEGILLHQSGLTP
eukprot:10000638-Ditylum_brightwellii.AAC.1